MYVYVYLSKSDVGCSGARVLRLETLSISSSSFKNKAKAGNTVIDE